MGDELKGIDVSYWQGPIDWPALTAQDIDFSICRSTFGSSKVDRRFRTNRVQSRGATVFTGNYHFCTPKADPIKEALFYVDVVGDLQADEIGPIIDLEWWRYGEPTRQDNITTPDDIEYLTAWLREFIEVCENTWPLRQPIIYTSPWFWAKYMGGTKAFDKHLFWVAQWGKKLRSPFPNTIMWQHSNRGSVRGIKGFVDLNKYFGSIYDLIGLTPACYAVR